MKNFQKSEIAQCSDEVLFECCMRCIPCLVPRGGDYLEGDGNYLFNTITNTYHSSDLPLVMETLLTDN